MGRPLGFRAGLVVRARSNPFRKLSRAQFITSDEQQPAIDVPSIVPTRSDIWYQLVAVAAIGCHVFRPRNSTQYDSVPTGAFDASTTTNQEAAGSSPAGRTTFFEALDDRPVT